MPAKSFLFPPRHIDSRATLADLLFAPLDDRLITRPQWRAIVEVLTSHLPATIELEQRTPLGHVYISINDSAAFTVNNRAKIRVCP
jgi:hypothetical protein